MSVRSVFSSTKSNFSCTDTQTLAFLPFIELGQVWGRVSDAKTSGQFDLRYSSFSPQEWLRNGIVCLLSPKYFVSAFPGSSPSLKPFIPSSAMKRRANNDIPNVCQEKGSAQPLLISSCWLGTDRFSNTQRSVLLRMKSSVCLNTNENMRIQTHTHTQTREHAHIPT